MADEQTPSAGWYEAPNEPGQLRYWDGEGWTENRHPKGDRENAEVSRAGILVAAAGAILVLVAIFLPHVESDTFLAIVDNTMIQSDLGWGPIIVVVLTGAALFRIWSQQSQSYSVLILGMFAIGYAVYAGTGDRVELGSVGPFAAPGVTDTASPGIGVYVCGIGGAFIALGGALLAGWNVAGIGPATGPVGKKKCPDCAESILMDAQVCKHCGYRFERAPAEPTASNS